MRWLHGRDVLVIVLALLVAVGAYAVTRMGLWNQRATGRVLVTVDGAHAATLAIGTSNSVIVGLGSAAVNTIAVNEMGTWMASSSCKNQLCVHQGMVNSTNAKTRALGNTIICLPNRVVVTLEMQGPRALEAPDV